MDINVQYHQLHQVYKRTVRWICETPHPDKDEMKAIEAMSSEAIRILRLCERVIGRNG